MAIRQNSDSSTWLCKSVPHSDVLIVVRGVPFTLDIQLLAARSSKIATLLKENSPEDLCNILQDIPADPETFELVAKFCYGFKLPLSTENVVPLACIAYYLGMTETHSSENLLKKAVTFLEQRTFPSWNESIKAIRTTQCIFQQAVQTGLFSACLESIATKAMADPRLLGEPIKNPIGDDDYSDDDDESEYRPNARRKLFVPDWKSEDLTTLPIRIYEAVIHAMILRHVPSEYVAASLCQYAKKWVFFSTTSGEDMSLYKRDSKQVIEAIERLLPREIGLLPCKLLFEMLRFAMELEASSDCRNGFEIRIGNQLDQAKVEDLLIPSLSYAKEVQYDIECVQRILKNFYANYCHPTPYGLVRVAELVDGFFAEVASDINLKKEVFISLAKISISASCGLQRNSDGIYRAIDIYLDKHRFLTESEKCEICSVLDCHNLSQEACEHAAQNQHLPLRVVVQVLFVAQLQLRGTITKEVQGSDDDRFRNVDEEEEEEEEAKVGCGEEEVMRNEMEKVGSKVMELEKECYMMRRQIESSHCPSVKKVSIWGAMKRKFGCTGSMNDCNNCQVKKKKVHPR